MKLATVPAVYQHRPGLLGGTVDRDVGDDDGVPDPVLLDVLDKCCEFEVCQVGPIVVEPSEPVGLTAAGTPILGHLLAGFVEPDLA